jgi:hypothetical protein
LVIQKALSKSSQDRYQTARELARAVEVAIPTNDVPPLPQESIKLPPPVTRKPTPAHKPWWGIAALATFVLVASGSFFLALLFGLNYLSQRQTAPTETPFPEITQTSRPLTPPAAELVPDWEEIGGSWTGPDQNGLIHGKTASFDGDALYLFKNKYSDFTFSVAVQALTREASLAVRMSDDGRNGYLIIFIPRGSQGGNPGLWLAKRVNGDHTFPAYFAADYGLAEWVRLTVEASGAHISILLNGEAVIDFEDVDFPFASGRLGLRCYGEPAAPCEANYSELYLTH